MDNYKKKSLNFHNEQLSRAIRHGQALQARESSRFKRLSIIRGMEDSSITEEVESEKSIEVQKVEKPTVSRLELLVKWKQEKQLKKELQMKTQKKPFYVGGATKQLTTENLSNKISQNMKFSFMDQTGTNINVSKVIKSKPVTVCVSKQPSRIPTNFKQASLMPKPVSGPNKRNNIAAFPKTLTKAHGNSLASGNQASSSDKKSESIEKVTVVKPSRVLKFTKANDTCQKKVPSIPKTVNKTPVMKNTFNGKNIAKTNGPASTKESSLPKLAFAKLPSKSVQKIPAPSTKQKFIAPPKLQKIPVLNTNQNTVVTTKLQREASLATKNVATRKGYCFKKVVTDVHKKQTEYKSTSLEKSESTSKEIKGESHSEPSLETNPGMTFNCDVSVIKPTNSFAPANFEFNPSSVWSNFTFEDFDDEDPYEALEQVKLKFMSRTSTPTKPPERSPVSKYPQDTSCTNSPSVNMKNSFKKDSPSMDAKNSSQNDSALIDIKNSSQIDSPLMDVKSRSPESVKEDDVEENLKIDDCETGPVNISQTNENLKIDDCETELVNVSQNSVKENSLKENLKIDNTETISVSITPKSVKENDVSQNLEIDNCETELVNVSQKSVRQNDADDNRKIDNCELKENDSNENLEIDNCEPKPVNASEKSVKGNDANENLKIENCEAEAVSPFEEPSASSESPFEIIDLIKFQDTVEDPLAEMKLKDEEMSKSIDILQQPDWVKLERKSAKFKRVMKSVSTLNAITEADDSTNQSFTELSKEYSVFTPRRSKRLSAQHFDIFEEPSGEKGSLQCMPATPRRSLRLQKLKGSSYDLPHVLSPFEEKNPTPGILHGSTRRSIRLIDLNTPEKDTNQQGCNKTDLTADFGRLHLMDAENIDPDAFFSPGVDPTLKPRKVSLLYTPEKNRKGVRKSVRGDLMSFSPSN